MLVAQNNLATTYSVLGRLEETLRIRQDVYSGYVKLLGEEHEGTVHTAFNYATALLDLQRFDEGKSLLRKVIPVARRVLGEYYDTTLRMRMNYAGVLAKLNRFEEAKAVLRKTMPVARRVLGDKDRLMLKMRWQYASTLYNDNGATLDDLREAVTTLEDAVRTAQRVFGGVHPLTNAIDFWLRNAQAALADVVAGKPAQSFPTVLSLLDTTRGTPSPGST